jgi:hypothetical protein
MGSIVAIDPGAKGGVALLLLGNNRDLILKGVYDMPDLNTLEGINAMDKYLEGSEVAIVEVQRYRAGNSCKATWSHAMHYGKLEMTLQRYYRGAYDSTVWVEPRWIQRVKDYISNIGISVTPKDRGDTKAYTWALAKYLFPEVPMVGPRGRKKDGIADAISLGWYYHNLMKVETYLE